MSFSIRQWLCAFALGLAQFGPATAAEFYSRMSVNTEEGVELTILKKTASAGSCKATMIVFSGAIQTHCPQCLILEKRCLGEIDAEGRLLLSESPLPHASARIPDGIVLYAARDREKGLAACKESERQANTAFKAGSVVCFPANTVRSTTDLGSAAAVAASVKGLYGIVFLLGALASAIACFLLVRSAQIHGRITFDPVDARPQRFHARQVPRVGGVALLFALMLVSVTLLAVQRRAGVDAFAMLVLVALPAFGAGLTEDLVKRTWVWARLAIVFVSAALGAWFLGAVLVRLDVPGLDALLGWLPIAVAVTLFAVGGVTNALNIVDGYNGLAAGYSVIVLAAFAWVAAQLGDAFLLLSASSMAGALIGFLAWNWPKGRIFLGDGGAYLLGFWVAELSVLMVARHPEVSPWFPLLLLAYPVFDTLFSIHRRKVLRGQSPGQADDMHLHQLVYRRLMHASVDAGDPDLAIRQNSRVAPYFWALAAVCAVPALLWWRSTAALIASALVFCTCYVWLYRSLAKTDAPELRGGRV